VPSEAIPVDPEQTCIAAMWTPTVCYQDIHFICCDCGSRECWTAESQRVYFEVRKGNIYAHPKRCHACRQKELLRKEEARRRAGHA
jgi:hypothetical protein